MSLVERSFILCPFLGGSTIGGFTVFICYSCEHSLSPSVQLRVESGKPTAQLISYSRSDTSGPKLSSYYIAPIQVPV